MVVLVKVAKGVGRTSRRTCGDCHLNKHSDTIACTSCHAAVYAKCKPTKVWWDWSKAGDTQRKPQKDKYGMADYNCKKGESLWKESAKPVYRWYGGFMKRVLLGDKLDYEGVEALNLTEPVGSINDPNSKSAPFKIMAGVQAVDKEHKHLLVLHLFPEDKEDKTAYWKHRDWQKAFTTGMQAADMALSCVQCHDALKGEHTCNRCHQDSRHVDFKKIPHKGTDFSYRASKGRDVKHLIGATDYIDFKALGYPGDPIISGGRFKRLPMGYKAQK